ncbi:MAG: hypothetical protein JW936_05330 [Sedimentisphaerales bacterium]|nr:hypothetical protein [Sedimentisphaerales bacterium]
MSSTTKDRSSGGGLLERTSAEAMEQLNLVFSAYNDATSRMQESYNHLQAEIVRLREELAQKNEQLQRKNRLAALGEMAAGMAHEIRNPLGAVQLYASLLERDLANEPDQLQWVRKISKGVQSLDLIVNDILAFTHDQACDKSAVNLHDLIQEVIDYVQPQAVSGSVRIDTTKVDSGITAQLDVNMIRRVMLNLLLNAIEASGTDGAVTITVVRCENEPSYAIRVMIEDTGAGIKRKVMDKIFNPFFTTKDTGTGLGLAIVHRLVECHGGVISAGNRVGERGAVFTILLP